MWTITSGPGFNFLHVGVLRALSGMLGAGRAGLALAERLGAAAEEAQVRGATVEPPPVKDWNLAYPSQSESAALLDAALGRARQKAGLAAS